MTQSYFQLLDNLTIKYNKKKNRTVFEGYKDFQVFKKKVMNAGQELVKSIQAGNDKPAIVLKRIENFRLGYYHYRLEHNTYKIHRCFVLDQDSEGIAAQITSCLAPVENVNNMLISLCNELIANRQLATKQAFQPAIKLNISATHFFNVLYQMSTMKHQGKPMIEIKPSEAAKYFVQFCSDSVEKPLSTDTVTKCFTKNATNRRIPKGEPMIELVMK